MFAGKGVSMLMSKSEYIIWRVESRMQIEEDHPEWSKSQIAKYLDEIEQQLKIEVEE